jgi:YidC/Oxa1 family membrane protein insertase
MDRNSIIGILLIGLILLGYSVWVAPTDEEVQALQHQRDSIEASKMIEPVADRVTPAAASSEDEYSDENNENYTGGNYNENDSSVNQSNVRQFGAFADGAEGQEEFLILENEKLKVTFTNRGGKIHQVELKDYKTFDQKPVILFGGDSSNFGLNFFAQNREISTNKMFFNIVSKTESSVLYRLTAGESKYIDFRWDISEAGRLVDYNVTLHGLSQIISQNTNFIDLTWKQAIYQKEKSLENEKIVSTIYYKFPDEEADYLSETDNDKENLVTKVKWVSFKQQFFNATLIAKENFDKPTRVEIYHNESETDSLLKVMKANFTLAYSPQATNDFAMQFYFGPNHFQTLKKLDVGLEKIIPLGWGIFGWVNKLIVIPIFNFLNKFEMNFGLIILILTIFIKLMLLPLTYKAFLSSAKMKVLKPEMEEIQKKNKGDQVKSQQELMALYKKAGVNPLGGCLPVVLQMPILIAMFRFFPSSIELRQEGFLWATDLSSYDSILDLPFSIPFYGDHVSLFTILMTISTLLYTHMNSQMTASNPQMKWMMYLMPVMFLGIFNNYSSGLSYYYFLANMISFGQQYFFRSLVDDKAIHAKILENKKKPQNKKKSKFQQRLEQLAKERGQGPKKK